MSRRLRRARLHHYEDTKHLFLADEGVEEEKAYNYAQKLKDEGREVDVRLVESYILVTVANHMS